MTPTSDLFNEKLRNYTFKAENLFPGIFYNFFFLFLSYFFYKGVTVRLVNNDSSSVVLVLKWHCLLESIYITLTKKALLPEVLINKGFISVLRLRVK